ncbi:hypothetical protein HDU87_006389 [Geranomyces variabilis]|uniref:Serine hydrolase domain-containing protein n=1 Tax=Geranomyces variabilis TaxID=109894 RepID=A0AAD5TFC9_9FUNG|nr:hypothetical protein HDU87_006389 [Geranomyces variabilis]
MLRREVKRNVRLIKGYEAAAYYGEHCGNQFSKFFCDSFADLRADHRAGVATGQEQKPDGINALATGSRESLLLQELVRYFPANASSRSFAASESQTPVDSVKGSDLSEETALNGEPAAMMQELWRRLTKSSTFSVKQNPLRLLCLHERGSSGMIMQDQLAFLQEGLGRGVELIFMDAPYVTDKSDTRWTLSQLASQTFCSQHALPQFRYIRSHGPIDGLLGLGDGGGMASVMDSLVTQGLIASLWRLTIIINGKYLPRNVIPKVISHNHSAQTRSLHIHSEDEEPALEDRYVADRMQAYTHKSGVVFGNSAELSGAIRSFMNEGNTQVPTYMKGAHRPLAEASFKSALTAVKAKERLSQKLREAAVAALRDFDVLVAAAGPFWTNLVEKEHATRVVTNTRKEHMMASDAITANFEPSLGKRKACPEVPRETTAAVLAQEASADLAEELQTRPATLSGQSAKLWEYVTRSQETEPDRSAKCARIWKNTLKIAPARDPAVHPAVALLSEINPAVLENALDVFLARGAREVLKLLGLCDQLSSEDKIVQLVFELLRKLLGVTKKSQIFHNSINERTTDRKVWGFFYDLLEEDVPDFLVH